MVLQMSKIVGAIFLIVVSLEGDPVDSHPEIEFPVGIHQRPASLMAVDAEKSGPPERWARRPTAETVPVRDRRHCRQFCAFFDATFDQIRFRFDLLRPVVVHILPEAVNEREEFFRMRQNRIVLRRLSGKAEVGEFEQILLLLINRGTQDPEINA
ncbi:hypothetical protein SDC9_172411 [bioreactor metagenome]|uniref:Uncharacterized protein n=1 Tax=bioreactor metagenome TaxID=1076179 RepID=A0A645GM38_9ZZZZ